MKCCNDKQESFCKSSCVFAHLFSCRPSRAPSLIDIFTGMRMMTLGTRPRPTTLNGLTCSRRHMGWTTYHPQLAGLDSRYPKTWKHMGTLDCAYHSQSSYKHTMNACRMQMRQVAQQALLLHAAVGMIFQRATWIKATSRGSRMNVRSPDVRLL